MHDQSKVTTKYISLLLKTFALIFIKIYFNVILHLNISDFKTALVGSFVDGVLEHAQEARLKTVVDDAGVKVSFEVFFSFLCFVVFLYLVKLSMGTP